MTDSRLKVGDKVLRPDGKWTRILSIERETKPTQVYNFEVEGNHNYFVGEIGVLSHNCAALREAISTFRNVVKPVEKLDEFDFPKVAGYVNDMRKSGGWIGEPALVTIINGERYLVEGTHRVHAAMEAGVDVVFKEVPFSELHKFNIYYRTEDDLMRMAQKTGGWSSR